MLAGGTWVVPELGSGVSRPDVVVDLRRAGLGAITEGEGTVVVGATATYADLIGSALVRERLPLLHEMAGGITGGWAIRGQGTIGGSLAAARPQSDVPAVLVALGAVAHVASAAGGRAVPVAGLLAGPMRTGLRARRAADRAGAAGADGHARLREAQARREQLADRDGGGGCAGRRRSRGSCSAASRGRRSRSSRRTARRRRSTTRGTTSSHPRPTGSAVAAPLAARARRKAMGG